MKRFGYILGGIALGALLFIGTTAHGQVSNNYWKLIGGELTPNVASWSFELPYIANLPCIGTDANGNFEAGTCGSGSGGLATTSPWVVGQLAQVASNSSVDSIATSSLFGIPFPIADGGTATTSAVTDGVYYYNGTNAEADNTLTWNGNALVATNGGANNGSVGLYSTTGAGTPLKIEGPNSTNISQVLQGSSSSLGLQILNSGSGSMFFLVGQSTRQAGTGTSFIGVNATSTPFSLLSIAGSAGGTTPLLAISSSTSAFATSTVFEIDPNGSPTIGTNGTTVLINNAGNGPTTIGTSVTGGAVNIFGGQSTNGITLNNNGSNLIFQTNSPAFNFFRNSTGDATLVQITSTGLTATAAVQNALSIIPTINQSSTGGYVGLKIDPTEVALGSTQSYFIESGTSTAPNLFDVTNEGFVGVGTSSPYSLLSVAGTGAFDGQVLANNGSAAAPAYSFEGNPNNGIYDTSNVMTFSIAGSARIDVQSTGIIANTGNGFQLMNLTALSATVPNIVPNRTDSTTGISAGAVGGIAFISSSTEMAIINNVGLGVGTTSPGSLLSIGGVANFSTATSTFYSSGGLNLTGGCYAVNGTCIGGGGGGSGTVTSITAGTGLSGGTITTSGTIAVNTTQNITTLSNLTVAGFVQTTSGGALSSAALTSGQVTTALGFTPFGGTNPLPIANGGTGTTTGGVTNGVEYYNGTNLTNSANFVELANGNIGIGTTTPFASLSIATTSPAAFAISDAFNTIDALFSTASTTGSIFTVAATTSPSINSPIKLFDIDQYGGITASSTGATPTVACSPSGGTLSTNSNDQTGTFTTGTLSTSCTVTFAHTKLATPEVFVQQSGTASILGVSATSQTAFTVSLGTSATGDSISYFAIQP